MLNLSVVLQRKPSSDHFFDTGNSNKKYLVTTTRFREAHSREEYAIFGLFYVCIFACIFRI